MGSISTASVIVMVLINVASCGIYHLVTYITPRLIHLSLPKTLKMLRRVFPIHIHIDNIHVSFGGPAQNN
jgi:hypothetical protein